MPSVSVRSVVPRDWPGATVVCLATGPSLTAEDVDYCRGKARVIAINDAYTLAPWADVLHASDAKWWKWHHGVPTFTGPKYAVEHSAWFKHRDRYPDVIRLRKTGAAGLELDPAGLRTGNNSGYQAINLAVHYGAARILLLGYDMKLRGSKSHFFGEHPDGSKADYTRQFVPQFQTLVKPLANAGVQVINCTRETALLCFPRAELREALPAREVAA